MMPRARVALAGAGLFIACSGSPISTPIRSFDRPSDVALTCTIYDPRPGRQLFEARPLKLCRPDQKLLPANQLTDFCNPDPLTGVPPFQVSPATLALVANSARGELAQVNVEASSQSLVLGDLDRQVPGFGFLPVGRLPEHVRASVDGCLAVTANYDSCDLAVVDLPVLYNMPFAPGRVPDGGAVGVNPVAFTDGGECNVGNPGFIPPPDDAGAPYGTNVMLRAKPQVRGVPLGARPSWIEIAPESDYTAPIYGDDPLGTPGRCTGGKYLAWVALPGCQLVVEVALAGVTDGAGQPVAPGEVVRALRLTSSGVQPVSDLSTLSCAPECASEAPLADGGPVASDGGSPLPSTQTAPASLAIEADPDPLGQPLTVRRMVIGDQFGERVTVLPLDARSGTPGPASQVALEAGALGVEKVRISPRSPAGQFLYAVARDGSVRVVDLDRLAECETNPDPRYLDQIAAPDPTAEVRRLGCFPLGDPATPPRSPLAISPGILLPGGALPRDVAFVHLDVPFRDPSVFQQAPASAGPSLMVGDFAWIVGSDGRANAVNLFDACPAPNVALGPPMVGPQPNTDQYTPVCDLAPAQIQNSRKPVDATNTPIFYPGLPQPLELDRVAHRLRGGNWRFQTPVSCGDLAGAPRIVDEIHPFALTVNGLVVASGTADGGVGAIQYPSLVSQPLGGNVSGCVAPARYIDFTDVLDVRSETWTLAWEGLLPGTARVLGRVRDDGTLVDPGASFCARGVTRGDKLVLVGCQTDSDCPAAQSCQRDPSAPADVTSGMCLDSGANQPFQLQACAPLLRAVRRWRILSAKQGAPDPLTGELTDSLKLAEIYEPEFAEQAHACAAHADCAAFPVDDGSGTGTTLPTRCLVDADGVGRCLRPCSLDNAPVDPTVARDHGQCGVDFQCAKATPGDFRCVRAPLAIQTGAIGIPGVSLLRSCLSQLATYEIHAGDSFLVSGSATGALANLIPDPATHECAPAPATRASLEYVRLHRARIPLARAAYTGELALPACSPELLPPDPSSPLQNLPPSALNPLVLPAGAAAPNACLYSESPAERQVRFENPYFIIALSLPGGSSRIPPDGFALTFQLAGGGFPLSAALGVDVVAQDPRSALTAPDGKSIYIIDEGKQTTATGLRGQLIRFLSDTQSTDRTLIVR